MDFQTPRGLVASSMLRGIFRSLLTGRRGAELIGSTLAINVLALASSLYSIQLLNRYVTVGLTPTLVTLTVGVVFAVAFELLLRRQRQNVLVDLIRRRDQGASHRVFRAFTQSRYEGLTAVPLDLRREALGAPAALQQLGSTIHLSALLDLPFVLLFIGAATLLHWPLGALAFLACLVTLGLGWLSERHQRRAAERHAKESSRAQQLHQFLLSAGEALRCLPAAGPLFRRWREVQDGSLGSRRDSLAQQSSLQHSIQSLGQLLTVMVYGVGAMAVVGGELSTGALIGANILAARAFAVVSRVAYIAEPLLRATRADRALRQVEAIESEPEGGATPANLSGRLEVTDAVFAYPNQPVPLFERLDLAVPPGEVLVVSGPNGSGKSTLIKLMLGLLSPQRGMVRADGIELRQLSQDWWRGQIGYAPQEPVFFDGSLRENLLLDREVEDDELVAWIRDIGLEEFLAADPAGLDRPITSHDTGLAMGLRRRFILVRAVLGDPRIVFLDDPTEGLDQAGQAAVASLLNRLLKDGRTLVVASNEPFVLRAADVVVDMGQKPVPVVKRVERTAPTPSHQGAAPKIVDGVDRASGAKEYV